MLLILLSSGSDSIANNRIISIRLYSSAILSAQTNSGPQMPIIFLSISFPFRGNRSLQSKRRYFCPSCCHKSSCLRCIPVRTRLWLQKRPGLSYPYGRFRVARAHKNGPSLCWGKRKHSLFSHFSVVEAFALVGFCCIFYVLLSHGFQWVCSLFTTILRLLQMLTIIRWYIKSNIIFTTEINVIIHRSLSSFDIETIYQLCFERYELRVRMQALIYNER